MPSFEFKTIKHIVSEPGALSRLPELCAKLGMVRPIIVSDQGIVACGLLEQLNAALSDNFLEVGYFLEVVADPPEAIVLEAIALARTHDADGVIGFGGGSSMDIAKLVSAALLSGQTLQSMYGIDQLPSQRLPLILVPTTAGTGSEATPISIVTTGQTTKAGIVSETLLPDIALLDANLTLGLPANVTAATGIDAMVHAIEAYTSARKKNEYSDMLARQALRLLSKNICTATFSGEDVAARQNMLLGACLAGQAFANAPVAAVHALAYPLGGHFHIPHGLSNALVLPHVMRFNMSVCGHLYAELIDVIEFDNTNEMKSFETHAAVEHLITNIEQLIKKLGLPTGLDELDIAFTDLDMLTDDAMLQERLLVNNPRKVRRDDALAIYQNAFKGRVNA
jgi:alcohol dehydrogenase